jgi:hypothetical protein
MHHFGEDMTTGRIEGNRFIIEARHHATQAVIQMTGPTLGVLSDPNQTIDAVFVDNLAGEFAHFLRLKLDSAAAVPTPG